MARIETDPNYSTPTFSRATAGTDLFKKEDVQALAAAVSTHDHATGRGALLTAVPITAIPDGSITSAKIADGTIDTADLKDGAVTSAKILDGTIATIDLAANAVSHIIQANSNTLESTTSASMVPLASPAVSITTTGGVLLAWFSGAFSNTGAAGNANNFIGLRVDSDPFAQIGLFVTPAAGFAVPVSMVFSFGAIAAGAHTIQVGVSTSAGSLSAATVTQRILTVVELKR